jgi:hypothetical protein
MFETEIIELTREELYEKVWTVPSIKLCQEFGFSDVALAKLCKKHHVPKPPLGYWAKVQNGRTVERIPLPKIQNSWLEKVRINKRHAAKIDGANKSTLGPEAQKLVEENIVIPAAETDLHPMALEALKLLRVLKPNQNGILEPESACLDVSVSPGSLDRAIKVFSAVLWIFEKPDNQVVVKRVNGNRITEVRVDKEPVQLRLEEVLETRQRELTAKEKKEIEKHPWKAQEIGFEQIPSGRLKFQIVTDSRLGYRTKWQDTQAALLEKSLPTFIKGVINAAHAERLDRLESEERERKWAEARKLEEERQNRIDDRKRRVYDLAEKVEEWTKSKELNGYLDDLERAWIAKNEVIDSGSEFAEWLAWARRYANDLNPIASVVESGLPYDKKRSLPSEYGAYSVHSELPKAKPWFPGRMWYQR